MHWRFLDTGFEAGDYNMALDFAMVAGGFCELPTLRVFRWRPYCISLGYHQKEEEIDLAACRLAGVDVARRPTAGRAIFHAEELTYSVVIPKRHAWYEMLPLDFYRRISEALARSLQILGVDAQFAPGERLHHDGKPLRLSCFASAARNEILAQGKKVIGSAQRRFRDGVLQHGSILLREGHERLLDFLAGNEAGLAVERARLQHHTATLAQAAGRAVTFEEMKLALKRGFEEKLEIVLQDDEVLAAEAELAEMERTRFRVLQTNPLEVSYA
jgi:lipoate-protein ligase A